MSEILNEWDQAETQPETLTVEAMDQMIQELRHAKESYEELQAKADEVKEVYTKQRSKIIDALTTLKRRDYSVDGAGHVYISQKEVYNTPKTNQDKTALFNYIKEKYGPDALMSLVSINSQTLTSWANKETETGEVMSIPGLDQPTMVETLNFRKK